MIFTNIIFPMNVMTASVKDVLHVEAGDVSTGFRFLCRYFLFLFWDYRWNDYNGLVRGEEANLNFLLILFLTLQHIQYSETCIKRTPYIKRTVPEVPKFIPLIFFKWNLY